MYGEAGDEERGSNFFPADLKKEKLRKD